MKQPITLLLIAGALLTTSLSLPNHNHALSRREAEVAIQLLDAPLAERFDESLSHLEKRRGGGGSSGGGGKSGGTSSSDSSSSGSSSSGAGAGVSRYVAISLKTISKMAADDEQPQRRSPILRWRQVLWWRLDLCLYRRLTLTAGYYTLSSWRCRSWHLSGTLAIRCLRLSILSSL